MGKLGGKTALVTGGSAGIGLATARLFMAEGARVAITGRDPTRLAEAAAELGSDVLAIANDARSIAAIAPLAERIEAAFGTLDILFLNAGVARYGDLETLTEAQFDEMFDVHVKAPLFTVQRLAPIMRDGGSIIFTTSVNNRIAMGSTHAYAASKAAERQLVRTLAGELAPRHIRVNALSPGPVATTIGRTTGLSDDALNALGAHILERLPLRRFAAPEELARAALFLASDDASFTTGTELLADGGWAHASP